MNKGFGAGKKKTAKKKAPASGAGFAYTGLLRPGVQGPRREVNGRFKHVICIFICI